MNTSKNESSLDTNNSGKIDDTISKKQLLPVLSSPLKAEKKTSHIIATNRVSVPSESKFSTAGLDIQTLIKELPHPCIIAVSHGSKIDIIKNACPDESFHYLKAEQVIDHEKFSQRLTKEHFLSEEISFVMFYLAHHRDGYRVLQPTLNTHKYILDYLQTSSPTINKDKKILCSLGGLYYSLEQTQRRQEEFSDYPICILDADRRHISYNNFAQKGINISQTLFQREKVAYILGC